MAAEGFQLNDLVWAKMRGYPPWPARIVKPLLDAKPPKSKKAQFVYFFGSCNFAWIQEKNITPHSKSMLTVKKKSALYQKAVDELTNFSKSSHKNKLTSPRKRKVTVIKKEKKHFPSVGENTQMEIATINQLKEEKNVISPRKSKRISKKYQPKVVPEACASKKIVGKRFCDLRVQEQSECASPKNQKLILNEDPHGFNDAGSSAWNDELENCSSFCAYKSHIMPTAKKIGFIGLGYMGKAIVCNLLRSGHDVMLFNKTTYKSDVLVEFGAKKAQSPAELVMACDIIFCSVSDPEASKAIVFGDCGILKGLCQAEKTGNVDKGYVEMTSIDPETSKKLHDIIAEKGCKYLEAPICGSSNKALEGTLMILASGNKDLFLECETCFHAIAKQVYFIDCNVGLGSKLSLLLSMFSGSVYATVAEALVLAKIMGVSQSNFLTLLNEGPLKCVIEIANRMTESDFTTVTPLKHVQKDLSLILALGNQFPQPLSVTAAVHEMYKHAKLLQYSDFDVSAVYESIQR